MGSRTTPPEDNSPGGQLPQGWLPPDNSPTGRLPRGTSPPEDVSPRGRLPRRINVLYYHYYYYLWGSRPAGESSSGGDVLRGSRPPGESSPGELFSGGVVLIRAEWNGAALWQWFSVFKQLWPGFPTQIFDLIHFFWTLILKFKLIFNLDHNSYCTSLLV